jgi:twitching motility protein PilJ
VVEGSKLADDAYGQLQEIENVATQLAELIQSISTTSRQQARTSQEIAQTMASVGEISARTSEASRETAVSIRDLAEISDRLNESVSVFKLEEK